MTNPLERQVDGTHYRDLTVQPIVVCERAVREGNFALGCMFKHLCRYPFKGEALTDLDKALHYAELSFEFDYLGYPTNEPFMETVEKFITGNSLDQRHALVLRTAVDCVHRKDFTSLETLIHVYIKPEMEQLCESKKGDTVSGYDYILSEIGNRYEAVKISVDDEPQALHFATKEQAERVAKSINRGECCFKTYNITPSCKFVTSYGD